MLFFIKILPVNQDSNLFVELQQFKTILKTEAIANKCMPKLEVNQEK